MSAHPRRLAQRLDGQHEQTEPYARLFAQLKGGFAATRQIGRAIPSLFDGSQDLIHHGPHRRAVRARDQLPAITGTVQAFATGRHAV